MWGKDYWCELCAIGTARRRKKRKKSCETKEKKSEKSSKVLCVEVRAQNNELGPKSCLNLPDVSKSWILHSKWILSLNFNTLCRHRNFGEMNVNQ